MRSWIIAMCAALSLGAMAALPVDAAPTADDPLNLAQAPSPGATGQPPQGPGASHHRYGHHRHHRHYRTVCHNVRVWKWTHHGRRLVWERRCHKVWR